VPHRITIQASYPATADASESPVKVTVEYAPDPALSPAKQGTKVGKLIGLCNKIGAVGASPSDEYAE
jgi:hypothetical protein